MIANLPKPKHTQPGEAFIGIDRRNLEVVPQMPISGGGGTILKDLTP